MPRLTRSRLGPDRPSRIMRLHDVQESLSLLPGGSSKEAKECLRPVLGQIVRYTGRDPGECESGISPLFESGKPRDEEDDCAERFCDSENDAQLLRVSHVHESLNRLRTA